MAQLHNPLHLDTHDAIEAIQLIFPGEQEMFALFQPVLCEGAVWVVGSDTHAEPCSKQAKPWSAYCENHEVN